MYPPSAQVGMPLLKRKPPTTASSSMRASVAGVLGAMSVGKTQRLSCTRLRVPPSRYTCRATRVAADFLDFIAFCRCSSGVAPHPLKILVSHLSPPPFPGGVAPKLGSEKVSRYTGVSQVQLRVSRYTVQLSPKNLIVTRKPSQRWLAIIAPTTSADPVVALTFRGILRNYWAGACQMYSDRLWKWMQGWYHPFHHKMKSHSLPTHRKRMNIFRLLGGGVPSPFIFRDETPAEEPSPLDDGSPQIQGEPESYETGGDNPHESSEEDQESREGEDVTGGVPHLQFDEEVPSWGVRSFPDPL